MAPAVKMLLPAVGAARLAGLGCLMIASALTEGAGLLMLVPLLSALAGDGGLTGQSSEWIEAMLPFRPTLPGLLAVFVALVAGRAILQVARASESARLQRRVVETLRARACSALLGAEWRTLGTLHQGETQSLLMNGVDRIGYGLDELLSLVTVLTLLGAALLVALALSPLTALVAVIGGGAVVLVYGIVRRHSLATGQDMSRGYAALTGRLSETLGALRVIKSFAAGDRGAGELAQVDRHLTTSLLAYIRVTAAAQALLQVAGAVLLAVLVWLATAQWGLSPLVLLPLVALFARVLPLLGAAQQHWQRWLNSRPALEETFGFIAQLEAAAEPTPRLGRVTRPHHVIALRRVTVRHASRLAPAIERLDLELPINSTTVLLGPSGSGKSTAADVLGGLLAPDEGALALDGRALEPDERIAWRAQVAYIQQEPVLFDLTIRENLHWAMPDASEAQMTRALHAASAQFVFALPQGLDTPVGDRGRQLSGGERQRLVLARGLLRDPALLILDEPTSALDPENEAAVAQAVARMQGKLTILIIGHRGALTDLAERRVRLESGRIVPERTAPA